MKLVSACLCGINCKYNGKNNINLYFMELMQEGAVIPVCPEQLGGLPTPGCLRNKCRFRSGCTGRQ